MGSHSLLQGIFLTQGLNTGLLHCKWILYYLSHQGSPKQIKRQIRKISTINIIRANKLIYKEYIQSSVQFSSVAHLCPTLCDPMNRSMPGLPVHHQLLEFTQAHAHRVSDAIQPSHPLCPLLPLSLIPPSIGLFQ